MSRRVRLTRNWLSSSTTRHAFLKKVHGKAWLSGGVMVKYFQLMGPEGIRLETYQLTANQESASQSMGRAWGYWWCSLGNGVPDLLKKMKTG
jgi:hypothetical protein